MYIQPCGLWSRAAVKSLPTFHPIPSRDKFCEGRLVPGSWAGQLAVGLGVLAAAIARPAIAQSPSFAANAQHTALYEVAAQPLARVRWSTSVDLSNAGGAAHYGAPLITPANTVLVPVRTTNGFQIKAFAGATGQLKYTLATDYLLPTYNWIPTYQPVLAAGTNGARLWYPGLGGTVYWREDVDLDTPGAPRQICFYTNLDGYASNASAFNNTVFINTPLTADTNGVIYFGFRVQGTAPAPLSTTNSGFARVDPAGIALYVLAGDAAGDARIYRDSHSCAPALSPDGSTLYVPVKATNANYAYLLGLYSTTLATKYKVLLRDPRNGSFAGLLDDGTASPMVAPDGDVFFGILANPNNGGRGFMLHFSADLQTQKPPSAFGWDYTPAIVPTNMLPGYAGTASYLLFSKYNNYAAAGDGDGINRLALLDPSATQIDPHPGANRLVEMREVLTVIACTPDQGYQSASFPYAVREWCINTAAVNPATQSIFAPCEDGRLYRWNLASNALTESFVLGSAVGQPYVPTVIGPDGTVYTISGGKLFALGALTNLALTIQSSAPDLRSGVAGQALTFTAIVTNLYAADPTPTGTVTFEDKTYQGLTAITNTLAANVPLTNGVATVTTTALAAGSNYLGSHFITAKYSGDATFANASATLVQKVHARATVTSLNSAPGTGSNVILTATVAVSPPTNSIPTGQVAFWDGPNLLAQAPLNTNGFAAVASANLGTGTHALSASYSSDTVCASSSGRLVGMPSFLTDPILLADGSFRFVFSNMTSAPFTVLGSEDPTVPLTNWVALGPATEVVAGQFQFTGGQATNSPQRFYRVRSP